MPDYYLDPLSATATTSSSSATASNLYAAISSPVVYMTNNDMKEYIEKTDKHIDELEEDIDFLNKKREELECEVYLNKSQLDELKKDRDYLMTKISDLETKIGNLEDKLDFYITKYVNK